MCDFRALRFSIYFKLSFCVFGYESDKYALNMTRFNELDRYLVMLVDRLALTNNPLDFWTTQTDKFLLLSKLEKRIYSIPALSAGVERQFSSAALVVNQQRTNINPEQVGYIFLILSLQHLQ